MSRSRRLLESEDGAVAPVVLLCMVVLLGFVALVLDAGTLFVVRTQLTKAVDAAAMAGAQNITGPNTCNPGCASAASQYAAANGVSASEIVGASTGYLSVANGANGICTSAAPCPGWQVTVQRTVPLVFAPVLHISNGTVTASAVAISSPAKSIDSSNLEPYAVWGGNNPVNLSANTEVIYRANPSWGDAVVNPDPSNCGDIKQPPCNPNWTIGDSAFKGFFHAFTGVYSIGGQLTGVDSKGGDSFGGEPLGPSSPAGSGTTLCDHYYNRTPAIFPIVNTASGGGGDNQFTISGFIALNLEALKNCGDNAASDPFKGTVAQFATWNATPGGAEIPGATVVRVLKLWQ